MSYKPDVRALFWPPTTTASAGDRILMIGPPSLGCRIHGIIASTGQTTGDVAPIPARVDFLLADEAVAADDSNVLISFGISGQSPVQQAVIPEDGYFQVDDGLWYTCSESDECIQSIFFTIFYTI